MKSKVSLFSKKEKSTKRVFQAKPKPASKNENLLSFFRYNSKLFMGKSEKELRKLRDENANLSNIRENQIELGEQVQKYSKSNTHSNSKLLKFDPQSTKNEIRRLRKTKTKANRRLVKKQTRNAGRKNAPREFAQKRSRGELSKGKRNLREKKFLVRSSLKTKPKSVKKSVQQMVDQAISRNFRKKLKKKAGQEERAKRKFPLMGVKRSIEKFFISSKNPQNCREIHLFPRINQIKIKNKIQFSRDRLKQTHEIFVLDKTRAKKHARKSHFKSVKISRQKAKRFNKFGTFTKRRKRVFMKSHSIRRISGTTKSVSRKSIFKRRSRGEGANLKCRTNSFSLKKVAKVDRMCSGKSKRNSRVKHELLRFQRALAEGDRGFLRTQLAKLVDPGQEDQPRMFPHEFVSRYQSKNQGNFNDFFDYRAVEFCQRIMDFWYIKSKNTVKEIFSYLKEELFLQSIKRDIVRICYWMLRILEDKCKVVRQVPVGDSKKPEDSVDTLSTISMESIGEAVHKEFQVELFFDSDNNKEKEKKNLLVRSAEYVGIFEEHPDKYIFDNLKVV